MDERNERICHIKRENCKEDVPFLHDLPQVRQSIWQELRGHPGRGMKTAILDGGCRIRKENNSKKF